MFPSLNKGKVKQRTLVNSDAFDTFDSFITPVSYNSPIKIYFLWRFSDYWSYKLLGVWVDIGREASPPYHHTQYLTAFTRT